MVRLGIAAEIFFQSRLCKRSWSRKMACSSSVQRPIFTGAAGLVLIGRGDATNTGDMVCSGGAMAVEVATALQGRVDLFLRAQTRVARSSDRSNFLRSKVGGKSRSTLDTKGAIYRREFSWA